MFLSPSEPEDARLDESPMKGAWRGRSQGRRRGGSDEPAAHPLPVPPEPMYAHAPPTLPPSRRAPPYAQDGRQVPSWDSWPRECIVSFRDMYVSEVTADESVHSSNTDPSVQLALIPPSAVDGGEFGSRSPFYRE